MTPPTADSLPSQPPTPVLHALRALFSPRELQALEATIALRMTAQQVGNVVTEWMADSVGSVARFQILILLWAAAGRRVPHKEIVATLAVTRATISGLMAGLERDGLVRSAVDRADRRNLLASLTPRGTAVVEKAIEKNRVSLRATLAPLSAEELATLTGLLQRVRHCFAAVAEANAAPDPVEAAAPEPADPGPVPLPGG